MSSVHNELGKIPNQIATTFAVSSVERSQKLLRIISYQEAFKNLLHRQIFDSNRLVFTHQSSRHTDSQAE